MSVDINVTDQIIEVIPTETQINVNITETPVVVDVTDQIIEITETGLQGPQGPAGPGVPTGGTAGQILAKIDAANYNTHWIDNYTTDVRQYVKASEVINKGQAVYVSGASGTNILISKASNNTEAKSSKTLGIALQNFAVNDQGYIITEGLLEGINTSSATIGDPIWLGINGNLLFGLANKPIAPANLVYLGVVTRVNTNNGEIFVHIQNGFELEELHNVKITNPSNGQVLKYNSVTGLWENATDQAGTGTVTSVNASGGTGISVSGVPITTSGTITITNTAPDQIVSLSGAGTTSISGTYPSFTITSNDQYTGTVTSVSASGGTGISVSGSPITSSGTLTITNTAPDQVVSLTGTGTTNITGTYPSFTINSADQFTGTVTSVGLTSATSGLTITNTPITTSGNINLEIATASGSQNGLLSSTDWTTFNNKQNALTLTTTGTSGAATLIGNTLNIPQYEAEGNYVTTATTLSINGTSYDLSANRSWSVGTVTSVDTSSPLTGGTITSSGTIGITQATTTTDGYLSSTDWNTFNNKQNALTNPVTGTGTTNYISKFTGTSTIGDSTIFDNGSGVGIGTTSLTGYDLRVSSNITGSTIGNAVAVDGEIQSSVTNQARLFVTTASTQDAVFTLGSLYHYAAFQGTFGASSSVTTQYGYFVSSGLTGATNNYGFYSNLASGTGRWNMYMNGTAPNYLNGSLGIGTTGILGYTNLGIQKTITGNVIAFGIWNAGQVQSDVTTRVEYYGTQASTQASTFTLTNLIHYRAEQGTFGAGSTVTTQAGFQATATLIGATNNYGFRGTIASGTGRWNLFMDGTAANHLSGNTIIGGTTDAGFKFDVQGTTRLQGTTTISGSTTAASAIARGVNITPTLVAAANNDVLVGVDITPTFTNGAFTGVENTALRVGGSILSRAANPLFIMRDTDLDTNALYLGADFGFASGLISYGSFAINRNPANGVFFNTGRAAAQINLESQVSNSGIILLTTTTNNTTPTERIRVFGNGNVGIGVGGTDAGFKLDINGTTRLQGATTISSTVTSTQFRLSALNTAPATASSTGTTGEIRIDANHIYVCTATNTWKRVAIATW